MNKSNYSVLKYLLTTASIASISLNGASIRADNYTANVSVDTTTMPGLWSLGAAPSIDAAKTPPKNNDTLYFGSNINITFLGGVSGAVTPGGGTTFAVDVGASSGTIIVGDIPAGVSSYTISAITPGVIDPSKNNLNIKFAEVSGLVITETQNRVNNIYFGNNDGKIYINDGDILGNIDGNDGISVGPAVGTLYVNGFSKITEVVGASTPIKNINVSGILTLQNNINSNITFASPNSAVALSNKTLTGNVEFNSIDSLFTMIDGSVVAGDIDSSVAILGIGVDNMPTLVVDGDHGFSQIGGNFGASNPLAIYFQSTATINIQGGIVNISGTTNGDEDGSIQLSSLVDTNLSGSLGSDANGVLYRVNTVSWGLGGTAKALILGQTQIFVDTLNGNNVGSKLIINGNSTLYTTSITNAITTINNNKILTLEGATVFHSTIDGSADNEGKLYVSATGIVTLNELVGDTHPLQEINITGGQLTVAANVSAKALKFDEVAGVFNLNAQTFTGTVYFNDAGDTINIAANGLINGDVDVITPGSGNLIITGKSSVTGVIGASGPLNSIKIGAADFTAKNNVYVNTLQFTAAGSAILGGNLTGNVDFNGKEGFLVFTTDGAIVTGDINGNVSVPAAGNFGNITIEENVTINGKIGTQGGVSKINIQTGKSLLVTGAIITNQITGDGSITIDGALQANFIGITTGKFIANSQVSGIGGNSAITFGNTGSATINAGLTGSVDFAGNNATLNLYGTITGSVNNSGGDCNGIIVIKGNSQIAGAIGATKSLSSINVNAGTLTLGAATNAIALKFTGNSSVNLQDNIFTGNVDFNNTTSTLMLGVGSKIVGNVGDSGGTKSTINSSTATITGTVGADNAVNIIFASMASILQIGGASANIASTSGSYGHLYLTQLAPITLKGTIGIGSNNPIGQFFWGGDRDGNSAATSLTLNGPTSIYSFYISGSDPGSSLIVNANSTIGGAIVDNAITTISNGITLTLAGEVTYNSTIEGDGASHGTLVIGDGVSAADVGLVGAVGGGAGGNNALLLTTVQNHATLTTSNALRTATLTLADGGNVIAGGVINATSINIGNASTLKANAAGIIGVDNAANTTITFTNAAGILDLSAGGTVTGSIVGSGAGSGGTVKIGANAATITGNFADAASAALNFAAGANTLTIGGATVNVSGTTVTTDVNGAINLNHGGAIALSGTVGQDRTHRLASLHWGDGAPRALTLNGATKIYAAAFGGNFAGSTLVVDEDTTLEGGAGLAVNANANTTINDAKTLTLQGTVTYNSTIDGIEGQVGKLAIGAGADVRLNSAVGAGMGLGAISQINVAGKLVSGANITASTLQFSNDAGSFSLNNTFTGDVDFFGKDAVVKLFAGTINGNVNNTGAANKGIINVGAGNSTIYGTINVRLVQINDNGANLNINNDLAGNIDFAGTGGSVTSRAVLNITGNIDGNVANGILAASSGNLIVNFDTEVSGTIGASGGLNSIVVGDGAKFTASNTVKATILQFGGAGTAILADGLAGNIDFAGKNSAVHIVGGNVSGDIDNTGAINKGLLSIAALNTSITGSVGKTAQLYQVEIADATSLVVGGVFKSNFLILKGSACLTANSSIQNVESFQVESGVVIAKNSVEALVLSYSGEGIVTLYSGLIGEVSFNGNDGILNLKGGNVTKGINNYVGLTVAGTLNITGTSSSGVIGSATSLKGVTLAYGVTHNTTSINALDLALIGTANLTTTGTITSSTIEIGAGTLVSAGIINADIITLATGTLIANSGIDGSAGAGHNSNVTIGGGSLGLNASTLTGNIIFSAGGTVTITAGKVTGSITTNTDSYGVVTLNNGSVSGGIGEIAARVDQVTISGNYTIEDTNSIYAKTIIIDSASTVNLNGVGSLGAATKISNVAINSGANLNVNNVNIFGVISGDNTGNVTFNVDPSSTGISTARGLSAITFVSGGTINKPYYGASYSLGSNSIIDAGADFSANSTLSIPVGKLLSINDLAGGTIGQVNGPGNVTFNVAGNIPKIGSAGNSVSILTLAGAGIDTVSNDTYANNLIIQNNVTYKASTSQTINGNLTLNDGSALDLQTNTLNVTGVVNTVASVTVNSILSPGGTSGNVDGSVRIAGKTLKLILDTSTLAKDDKTYQIFSSVDGEPSSYTIEVSHGTGFNFEYSAGSVKSKGAPTTSAIITSSSSELLQEALIDPSEALLEVILNEPSKEEEILYRNDRTLNHIAQERSYSFLSNVVSTVATHLHSTIVNNSPSQFIIAPTAGDEDYKSGVWVQSVGNLTEQGKKKGNPGYRSTTLGSLIGYDTEVRDGLTFGGAVIFVDTKVKAKDQKQGDRVNEKTWMFSLYSMYEINNHWFTRATTVISNTNVITTEKRMEIGASYNARGEHNSKSGALDGSVGYIFNVKDQITMIQELGVNASFFADDGYKEEGQSKFNRIIEKHGSSSYSWYYGALLRAEVELKDSIFSPSIHAKLSHEFAGKSPVVTSKFSIGDGLQTSKESNLNKTICNTGFDLKISNGMIDATAGYDLGFAKKYYSHTGSLKLRINF